MFVKNFKLNSKMIFKIIFVILFILIFIMCMTGSKQTHIFKRKSGQLVTGRVHGTTEIKYDIDFGIDDMEF